MPTTPTLEDLHPSTVTVEAAGAQIPLRAVRVQAFTDLIREHPSIAAPFVAEPEKRSAAIVKAVIDAGGSAINTLIDASIGWEPGTAAQAPFSIAEELRLVQRIVEHSLPAAELEKLRADAAASLSAYGLEMEAPEEEASED